MDKQKIWSAIKSSVYVTHFTDWFTGFTGRAAQFILILTTLYTSAELYPGLKLPENLNIAVFIIQMLALDIGGIGLYGLARQAEAEGNLVGAKSAKSLAKWLISIMIAGVVTVSLNHVISGLNPPKDIQSKIDVAVVVVDTALVIARSVCAVWYGVVVHSLEKTVAEVNRDIQDRVNEVVAPLLQQYEVLAGSYMALEQNYQGLSVTLSCLQNEIEKSKVSGQLEDKLVDDLGDTLEDSFVDNKETHIVDISEYRSGQVSRQLEAAVGDTKVSTKVTKNLSPELSTKVSPNLSSKVSTNLSTKVSTENGRGDARQRALRTLKKYPKIGATELSEKAKVSRSYAAKIIAESGQICGQ